MSTFPTLWFLLLACLLGVGCEAAAEKIHGRDGVNRADRLRLPRKAEAELRAAATAAARPAPSGYIGVHDPSGIVWEESSKTWYLFGTGGGLNSSVSSHVSTDGYTWSRGAQPFTSLPVWIPKFVPGNTGGFWAPDLVHLNGLWHLFYAVSTWAGPFSCVGVTTTPSLGSPNWTDSGMPVVCDVWWEGSTTLDAIDPHVFVDPQTGRTYLDYGSFRGGVYIVELSGHPVVSKRVGDPVNVQRHSGSSQEGAEASWVQVGPNGSFYLFGNWGSCCNGIRSTYNVRVGVSSHPLGPYIDKAGSTYAVMEALSCSTAQAISMGQARLASLHQARWGRRGETLTPPSYRITTMMASPIRLVLRHLARRCWCGTRTVGLSSATGCNACSHSLPLLSDHRSAPLVSV